MKQSSFRKLSSVLLISIAVLIVALGIGNYQNASAASSQSHEQVALDPADISAYRWEAAAAYYASHQVWPADLRMYDAAEISAYRWQAMADFYAGSATRDLTALDAADVSAYRWQAMADFYAGSTTRDLTKSDTLDFSDYRIFMVAPGVWVRQTPPLH